MPRFFFDIICGDERIDDVEGQDLADLDGARLAGVRVAGDVLSHELLRDQPCRHPLFEIRDAEGNLIETIPLSG